MPEPLCTYTKTKKTNYEFKRHHCDRYKRVKPAWRKPRGIDNRVRRKLKGSRLMPGKRYMNEPVLRHMLVNGFRKVLVSNVDELEVLSSQNRLYCAEIRSCVGARKRIEIVNKAKQLDILVLNDRARLVEEENE